MTDNDDTGQPVPLPLMERVRLGLRIEETELTPEQIAELEFPKDSVGQTWWRGQIEQAIKAGALAAHVEKTVTVIRGGVRLTKKYRDGVLVPGSQVVSSVSTSGHHQDITRERYLVPRDAYAGWRTGAAVFRKQPDACIDLWLPLFPILAPAKATPVSVRTVLPEMADYLPLREQARLGYLPDALHVEQIATLEYPDNRYLALAYAKGLLKACDNRELASLGEQEYQDWWLENGATGEVSEEFQWWYKALFNETDGCPTPLIINSAFRDWLLQKGQPLPSWWFPLALTNPSISTTPKPVAPTLPAPIPDTGAAEKYAALESLLAEIDKRALEQGAEFNRHSLPGTKAEFFPLVKAHCSAFRYVTLKTLDNYLSGYCQFQRGSKPKQCKGKAIWELFPEHEIK